MIRKRIHKDFDAVIVINRAGAPIDISEYEVLSVKIQGRNTISDIQEWEIKDGKIFLHVSRELIKRDGEHCFVVEYRKADPQLEDGYWNFQDNSPSFMIVKRTEDEDDDNLTISIDLTEVIRGERGYSAYEAAVQNGYVGGEDEWIASLKGEQGIQGIQGVQGERGLQGEMGLQGVQGEKGDKGADGITPQISFSINENNELIYTVIT